MFPSIRLSVGLLVAWSLPTSAVMRRTRVTFVNGIAYRIDQMPEAVTVISKHFGGKNVSFYHNPTAMVHDEDMMGYLGDLTQAGTQKLGRITAEVDALVKHLKTVVAEVGRRGRVIHIAHSQGALLTSLASKQLLPDEMKQIEVLAFGGAAALRKSSFTPFHRVVNYYAVNDPILLVVPPAAQALRSGLVGDDEFCFLTPRTGDPIADHDLLAPTYSEALMWEGQRFQRKYQSQLLRLVRSFCLSLMMVLKILLERINDMLKAVLKPALKKTKLMGLWLEIAWLNVARYVGVHLIIPLVRLLGALLEALQNWFRSLRGEDEYEPVTISQTTSSEG